MSSAKLRNQLKSMLCMIGFAKLRYTTDGKGEKKIRGGNMCASFPFLVKVSSREFFFLEVGKVWRTLYPSQTSFVDFSFFLRRVRCRICLHGSFYILSHLVSEHLEKCDW